jgi:hypothetical protein
MKLKLRDEVELELFEQELIELIVKHRINDKTNIPDVILVKNIIYNINQLQQFDSDMGDFFESSRDVDLDGDARTALASAGFGTDEDYGSFGGTED